MGSAIQQLGQFAYSQESRIQAAKRSEMGRAVPQAGDLLMRILAAKYSENGSAVPQGS